MLGYFSIIGLLRVHVHLGDFTLGLKVLENVELNQKVDFTIVSFCVLTLETVAFHEGYSMSRRHILLRWLLLHHVEAIPRRHPYLCDNPQLHHAHASIPHKELPV